MEFKKSMLILIMAIFFVSIAGVCAADANDTVVASDDANQIEVSSNDAITEDSLQTSEENTTLTRANDDEIVSAEDDCEILTAGEGTYYDLINEIGDGGDKNLTKSHYSYTGGDTIEIKNSGVINGNGAVIDMAGSNIRAFYVTASGVTIKDLTIKNANYNSDIGGAIYFISSGAVENCNFLNNTALIGGAIYFKDFGNVTNCNFNNNAVTTDAGAILFNSSGSVTNCNFTNNNAMHGGAILFNSSGSVINCNFEGNSAATGGAIFSEGSTDVTNCNFNNNIGSTYGGAMYFCNRGTVINCNFTNNHADSYGGAIWFNIEISSDAIHFLYHFGTVINCNFEGNIARNGGAIASLQSNVGGTYLTVTVDTCIFKTDSDSTYKVTVFPPMLEVNNFTTAYNSGKKLEFNLITNGGMPVYDGNISISVYNKSNDMWVGNYSCLSGEGWTVDLPSGFYYAVFNTEYKNFEKIRREITVVFMNESEGTYSDLRTDINNGGNLTRSYYRYYDGDGDIIEITTPNLVINGNGAVIDMAGSLAYSVFYAETTGVTFKNLTIKNYWGGNAIIFDYDGTVENCNFINNTNEISGGIIVFPDDVGSVKNCNFANNVAVLGAIYMDSGSVTNCSFVNNSVSRYGGAIYMSSGSVTNCDFVNNTAEIGGAIWFKYGGEVSNCNFVNNAAVRAGAMYFNHEGYVENCNFTHNIGKSGNGGAIRFIGNGIVKNCNFANNVAVSGGAMYFDNTGEVTKCNFANNVANRGGAIYSPNGTVTLVSCVPKADSDTLYPILKMQMAVSAITTTYNINRYLVITVKDINRNPLKGISISVNLNGVKNYVTDKNGQVKIATKGLTAKTYTAKITTHNAFYNKLTKDVRVTVKKATPAIIAKNIKLNAKAKTKKYAVTLKSNIGKAISKTKLTLKIGKNTFTAKTNAKGQATFNLKKLSKKGKYNALITYKGNNSYKKVTKKVKIKLK